MCVKITGRSIVGELVKREMYIFRCVSFTIRISFNAIEWKKDLEIYLAFRFDFPFPTIRLKSHFRIFPSRLATDFIQDKKTVKSSWPWKIRNSIRNCTKLTVLSYVRETKENDPAWWFIVSKEREKERKEERKVHIDRRLFRNDRNGGRDRVRDKGGEREIRKKVERCWGPRQSMRSLLNRTSLIQKAF